MGPRAALGVALAALGALAALWRARSRSFRGRVVLVTGGSRGLGLEIARQLAEEGARIALIARDPTELAQACADVTALGGECLALPCDVVDRAAVADAVARTVERFGQLDAVINAAATIQVGPIEHMVDADFQEALDVSFWGPLHVIRAALPHLVDSRRPRILNVASIAGRAAHGHLVAYSVGKAALDALSDGLRAELAQDGIRVTTVDPGPLRTGGHRHAEVKGRHEAEYAWFAALDQAPGLSVGEEQAARRIVRALRRGAPVLTIGWMAKAVKVGDALMPRLMARLQRVVVSRLPAPTGPQGDEVRTAV